MDQDFWHERWRDNKIGFHRPGVNPQLKIFWDRLSARAGERILVPLCGKSQDLLWLADQGQKVCGVELSEIAARAFGKEQGIDLAEDRAGNFLRFNSPDIEIYVGDFLSFTREAAGVFPLFYDRAALIALPPDMRGRYAAKLVSLLGKDARGLLITLEYDQRQMGGPPFSVTGDEVQRLFPRLQMERLSAYDCLDEEPRFKERGVQWMKEVVYLAQSGGFSS